MKVSRWDACTSYMKYRLSVQRFKRGNGAKLRGNIRQNSCYSNEHFTKLKPKSNKNNNNNNNNNNSNNNNTNLRTNHAEL